MIPVPPPFRLFTEVCPVAGEAPLLSIHSKAPITAYNVTHFQKYCNIFFVRNK